MFSFEQVFERDIDFVIMRNFASSTEFAKLFLDCLDMSEANVISVDHSVTDNKYGESDIVIKVESEAGVFCLLIEDKVDAEAMPEQYDRYVIRGDEGKRAGSYSDYAVFIAAPEAYLNTNKEAQKYPHKVSYETMRDYFKCKNMLFESELLDQAITKQAGKYAVREDKAVTDFWNEFYEYSKTSKAKCNMYPVNGAKGSRSLWVQFKVPLRGTALYYKSDKSVVDLEFSGKSSDSQRIKNAVNTYKDCDMHWYTTGNSISLRLNTSEANFSEDFEKQKNAIDKVLNDVERLAALAIKLNDIAFDV